MTKIAVLGAGSWGLTLAWLTAGVCADKQVSLWDRNADKVRAFSANRNITFPVEVQLPEAVRLTNSLTEAIEDADIILFVVSSAGTRPVAQAVKASGAIKPSAILVNASKGIEYPSLRSLSQVLAEELPGHAQAVLSGPTLAKEILMGLPTACTVAAAELSTAEYLQKHLTRDTIFRVYSNTDVIGAEMGGALKNIFAIASGYIGARNLGENAKSAFITRGLSEMTRFCMTMGAEQETLFGLSGLGDLLATCNSPLSRNYQVGYQLAQGTSLDEVLSSLQVVAEGVQTTQAVAKMASQLELDMPIAMMVESALQGGLSTENIIKTLMGRKLKSEKTIAS